MTDNAGPSIALVLAGDVGLGGYQAGAYEALHRESSTAVCWVAGSSIGSVNWALIVLSVAPSLPPVWSGRDLVPIARRGSLSQRLGGL
jgi:predicted acylesterase/phospholipase RssA